MVRLLIANTDFDWFETLSNLPTIDEVNFWQPSGRTEFHALQPGELFAFRLKAPRNVIAGFGVFQHATRLPLSLAWEAFGIKNGAVTLEQMRQRVGRYRPEAAVPLNWEIGCRILVQPIFLPEPAWIPLPASWSRNIVSFKTYGTDEPEGRALWEQLANATAAFALAVEEEAGEEPRPRYGDPVLVKPRLGQGAFRVSVLDAYDRTCAVSRGRVLPALDAAHIKPYAEGGAHQVANGILMRRDIHSVFDAGYVTIDPDLRLVVSDRVRTEFNNGNEYRRLHGSKLWAPPDPKYAPDRRALAWHNENCFLG